MNCTWLSKIVKLEIEYFIALGRDILQAILKDIQRNKTLNLRLGSGYFENLIKYKTLEFLSGIHRRYQD